MATFIIEEREGPGYDGPWSEPREISRIETDEDLGERPWTLPSRHSHYGKPYYRQRRQRRLNPEPAREETTDD